MLHPAIIQSGHLTWTRDGGCWAIWQLEGMSYGLRSLKEKRAVRLAHQALFRAITGESMILSVVVSQDPMSIVQNMLEGVDPERSPAWVEECNARLDSLQEVVMGERLYFLAVPLPQMGFNAFKDALKVTEFKMKDLLGLHTYGISPGELRRRQDQADRIEALIPKTFSPKKVTLAQQKWLDYHLIHRGVDSSGLSEISSESSVLQVRHYSNLIIDEGGQTERDKKSKLNPFAHRYVKVGTDDLFAQNMASYQSFIAITGLPAGGLQWPGSELLGNIDTFLPGVDWVLRLNTRSSSAAKLQNKRTIQQINDQLDQRAEEVSTGQHDLDEAIQSLTEFDQILTSDKNEVAINPTIILSISSDSASDVAARASAAIQILKNEGLQAVCPAGYQQAMWWSFVPGMPTSYQLREFRQIFTSKDLSGLVPITVAKIGDSTGPLLGINTTSNLPTPIHIDLPSTVQKKDVSGCIGVAGELGSGKSTTLKVLVKPLVDCGNRLIVTDRSETGEWVEYVKTLTRPLVVDMQNPLYSLDPLRAFPAAEASLIVSNFLVTLLDVVPTSDEGILLSEVLEEEYLKSHGLNGLGEVLDHLVSIGDSKSGAASEARHLAGKMKVFARKKFGRVLFDNSLPALPWKDSLAIVIRTNMLEMPEDKELEQNHLFRQMRLEKVFGRAAYTLISALARTICFADRKEFAVYVEDEAHMVTRNELSMSDIKQFIRDGRKHGAALILGSHDPVADFGDKTMRGLIKVRIAHRHTDVDLAKRTLEWLGVGDDDGSLLDELMKDTSPQVGDVIPVERRGEGFIRDASGSIGRIKVLLPASERSRVAANTTPGRE